MSKQEYGTFLSKIGEMKNGVQFAKTVDNKYTIPIGDKFGINNVLEYTNGNYNNPSIDTVIKINLNLETNIDIIRSQIYDYEKAGTGYAKAISTIEERVGQGIIDTVERTNYDSYQELKRQRNDSRTNNSNNNQQQDRTGDIRQNKYSLREYSKPAIEATNKYLMAIFTATANSYFTNETAIAEAINKL